MSLLVGIHQRGAHADVCTVSAETMQWGTRCVPKEDLATLLAQHTSDILEVLLDATDTAFTATVREWAGAHAKPVTTARAADARELCDTYTVSQLRLPRPTPGVCALAS